MDISPQSLELFLLVACAVAILSRRIGIPYTVGLLLGGFALSHLDLAPPGHLSHELIFSWLLPPLIFESALHLSWRELRPQLAVVSLLATVGVVAAALTTMLLLVWGASVPWQAAVIIGVALSATDPVSVLAILKEARLPARIHRLVESESLLNDGTSAALFSLAPLLVAGTTSIGSVVSLSALSIAGGLVCGAAVGGAALALAGRTTDHLVEVAVTILAAFGSFYLAESVHASGILSTLAAGMVLGSLRERGFITERGHESAESFWEFAGFLANSAIFLFIGIDLDELKPVHHSFVIVATIAASLLSRAAVVYLGCLPFHRSRHHVPLRVQHLLFWGGLRGALALALILGLPPETPDLALIRSAVFYAVAFSVVIQGLTVGRLIRSLRDS